MIAGKCAFYRWKGSSASNEIKTKHTHTMSKVICFRATDKMKKVIERIMDERMIDCTTVMKLALYHFDSYMQLESTKQRNLHEIVKDLEASAASGQESFVDFALSRRG